MHRCDDCGRDFPTAQGLNLHRIRSHRSPGEAKPAPAKPKPARRPEASDDGQVADRELQAMAKVLDLIQGLSPEGRAWLAARLGS